MLNVEQVGQVAQDFTALEGYKWAATWDHYLLVSRPEIPDMWSPAPPFIGGVAVKVGEKGTTPDDVQAVVDEVWALEMAESIRRLRAQRGVEE